MKRDKRCIKKITKMKEINCLMLKICAPSSAEPNLHPWFEVLVDHIVHASNCFEYQWMLKENYSTYLSKLLKENLENLSLYKKI